MKIKISLLCAFCCLATVMCEEKNFTPSELEKFNGEDVSLLFRIKIQIKIGF